MFPFVGTALIALAGIPILYTFPRVDDLSPQTAEDASPLGIRQAIELLRGQLTHPDVRWFVVFAAVFYSLFVVTRIYEQPVLDTVGIPVAGLGVLYAGFKLVSAVIVSTAGRVHDLFGTRGVMAGIAPVYAVTYASIAVAPFLIVVTLFLNRGLRTLTNPVINQYLNTHTDDMGRATVLSGASMVLALIGGGARILAGRVADVFGPVGFLPRAGLGLSILGGAIWFLTSPVRAPAEDETAHDADGPTPN